jgi:hypothetical protein
VASVPFTLAPEQNQLVSGSESHVVKTQVVGVVTLDDDELRVQYRVIEQFWRYRGGRMEEGTTESEVREHVIPLRSLRSVRVAGLAWWPRLEIAVADLRALEGFPRAATGEVSLRIRRRDRTDARELASHVEYALAERLLSPPPPPLAAMPYPAADEALPLQPEKGERASDRN